MELVINTSLSNLNDSGGSEWARKINQFYGLCFDGPQFLTPENFTVRFVLEPENVPILLQDPSLHLNHLNMELRSFGRVCLFLILAVVSSPYGYPKHLLRSFPQYSSALPIVYFHQMKIVVRYQACAHAPVSALADLK